MICRPQYKLILIGASIALFLLVSCKDRRDNLPAEVPVTTKGNDTPGCQLIVLGTIQDAGSPQIGCEKDCCHDLWEHPDAKRKIVSLGVLDRKHNKRFLFETTPDITAQLYHFNRISGVPSGTMPDGVLLTHAHIGHYAGLMFFGKEALNTRKLPVYAMPRMADFLENNGPWSQLVAQKNIEIHPLETDSLITLTPSVSVRPVRVPHRDEYSETVGYIINGPRKKALFIPDIDKWDRWDQDIADVVATVDYAFLDATFFDGNEINTRDISEIPHPFVEESMELFNDLPAAEKQKIYFIHFNHTNPLLSPGSEAYREVSSRGFNIATYGDTLKL